MNPIRERLAAEAQDWQRAVAACNLSDKTVHGAELASASQMGRDQFLLLRVLWKTYTRGPLRLQTMFGMAEWLSRAEEMLKHHNSWRAFCDGFAPSVIPEGDFAIPRLYQLEATKTNPSTGSHQLATPIIRRTRQRQLQEKLANLYLATPSKNPTQTYDTPVVQGTPDDDDDDDDAIFKDEPSPFQPISPTPKDLESNLYPPSKDEQIVNIALVVWTMHRIALTAQFEAAQFEARTDSYLVDSHGKPTVLIEVKPVRRSTKMVPIQIQESAQMVAWIKSDGDLAQSRKVRFHISQDRHEIYVTVAEYNDDYLAYLNSPQPPRNESTSQRLSGEEPPKPPEPPLAFLTMHQFGPFDTLLASHIREIGPILLAITLRAEAESSQVV
ncbi:hypothetical protein BDV32DRAFT_136830 [Aspergillus pseudonomiae]|nr:hypothetical protein BDV32DRAFT_136830 [Aspergillus pseudonomiae]